jgi:Aspartyl protease
MLPFNRFIAKLLCGDPEPNGSGDVDSRGRAMSRVSRLRRLRLALTCFPVSALLLALSVAGAEPQATAPLTDPPGAGAEAAIPQVLIEAPEPRFAAPTLRDRIGRIWAPVFINGQGPFRLVLDTGASHSAIIAAVAASLGIPVSDTANVRVSGVTGSAMVHAIPVDSLEVGELSIEPSTLPIVADVFGGAEGVLGTEGLADKRILIDFAHDRVVISRSRGALETKGLVTLPLRLLHDRLLALDVRVGGIRAKAIVDTGAQVTIGNLALRAALTRHATKNVKKEEIIGVTLDVMHGDTVLSPPIAVGSVQFRSVNVTYADMFIFDIWKLNREPTLVLGMDVLGSVDVLVIDYRLRELQIRVRHP